MRDTAKCLRGGKRTTEICRGSRDPLKVSQYCGSAQLTAQGCRMDGDQSDSIPFLVAALCAVATVNQTLPVKQLNLHSLNTSRKKESTTALSYFSGSCLQRISPSDLRGCVSMKNSEGETCKLPSVYSMLCIFQRLIPIKQNSCYRNSITTLIKLQ